MQTESDPINPNHYKAGDIECIDAIKASLDTHAFHGHLKASVMKYLWRYDKKMIRIFVYKKHNGL